VGLVVDVVADTQELATALASRAGPTGSRFDLTGHLGGGGNFAYPFSPGVIPTGAVYEWSAWHVMDVDDERESPSYRLLEKLKHRGAEVAYYDPYVPVIRPTREHPHWTGVESIRWDQKTIAAFDAVVVATAHDCVNHQELADWAQIIIDTRNAMAKVKVARGKVWKA